MSLAGTCDAWIAELLANVAALSTVTLKTTHRYASWSPEQLYAQQGERHLAIWPQGEIESAAGIVTAPADMLTQSYSVLVWEEAASEATGLYDDDNVNELWLALYEAVRARFYVLANVRLGNPAIMATRFRQSSMGMRGAVRWMELQFTVEVPISYT